MSAIVDVSATGVRLGLSRERVRSIAQLVLRRERVRDALISVTFVSSRRMAALNRAHLGHPGPTDVISFALDAHGHLPGAVIGDIYISPEVARVHALAAGVPVREELARLVIHGILHVLGHEHPEGEDRERSPMWRRQEVLLPAARRVVGW